jgi:hypothetical protein
MVLDYSKGKIYKIWSPSQDIQYIGSTTQELSHRLGNHKKNFKLYYNKDSKYNNYYTSFEVLKCDDCRIDLLENYSCNDKTELLQKEGEYIKNNICVNKIIAGRSKKQHYIDNKELISKQQKLYREINKEKLAKQNKLYQKNNKELISKQQKLYRENNKEKIAKYKKLYRENNKEIIAKRDKLYRENNKEIIAKQKKDYYQINKEKLKEKTTCHCGSIFRISNKPRHYKSLKHQNYMKTIEV